MRNAGSRRVTLHRRDSDGGGTLPRMVDELKELWRFRELLVSLVARDLKVRYKNSTVGFFWSFLTPLMTVAVMTFAFNYVMAIT